MPLPADLAEGGVKDIVRRIYDYHGKFDDVGFYAAELNLAIKNQGLSPGAEVAHVYSVLENAS